MGIIGRCRLIDARRSCILSLTRSEVPPTPLDGNPHQGSPSLWVPRSRGAAPPAAPFPFWVTVRRHGLLGRPVGPPRSSTWTAPCSPGAAARSSRRPCASAGLIGRSIPGERMMYGLFSRVGENLPAMMLARQAATLAKGRSRQNVQAAAQAAADVLVGMIQPFAGPVIEQHKAAGRRLVMATTTPVDLVRPLAERLGFDDVVATTLRRQRRRHLRRHHRRALRVGQRQAGGRAGVGRPPRHRHGGQLRVLRQRVRHPACCRPSATRSPSTPIRGCSSWP